MFRARFLYSAVTALVLMGQLAPMAWAQTSTGAVSGTVRDQTGAVVPSATVTLTNTATNVSSKTTANEVGFYLLPNVVPGPYRLTVEAPGMQKFEGILIVQVGQSAVVDVALQVGTTVTAVEVLDVTPLVTVDRPTLGQVLERTRIEQLPINGRALTTLLGTVPGVVGLRAYGQRAGSLEVMLDGAPLNDRNEAWLIVMREPGLDTVEEFNVQTNNSSAKFTRPMNVLVMTRSGTNEFHGSVFETHRNNAIGKARSRTDYYRKPPQLIRNEFGVSAGGPAVLPGLYNGKDRTFWFLAYEGSRNSNPATMGAVVPTEAQRNGDFRGLVDSAGRQFRIFNPWTTDPTAWSRTQFAYQGQLNTIDPALISPVAKYLFEITPLPTHPQVNPLVDNNWWGPAPNTIKTWTVTTRVDHTLSDKDRLFARYTQGTFDRLQQRTDYNLPVRDNVAGLVRTWAPNRNLVLSWVRTFSPTFFNEVLASVARQADWAGSGLPAERYADKLGLPNPFGAIGWPKLGDTGLSGYRFWSHNTRGVPYVYAVFDNNATKVLGRHEFQFGFHYRYDQLNFLPDQQQKQGRHSWATLATSLYDPASGRTNPLAASMTGHNLANMYIGVMNYLNQLERTYFYMRTREYALYFQDNYKVTPRLTLNLGLRWEHWPAFREKNGVISSFDLERRAIVLGRDLDTLYRLGATVPAVVNRFESLGAKFITYEEAGLPKSLMQSTKKDFGPRLGFAYRTGEGSRSLVARGGYRISYYHVPARTWVPRMALNNTPFVAAFQTNVISAALTPDGIPNFGLRSVPAIIAGKNSRNAVDVTDTRSLTRGAAGTLFFDRVQPDPRVHDWNFTLEKEIMTNTVVRASYVGNHGDNIEQRYLYNESTPEYIWYVTTGEPLPTGEYSAVARRPYDQRVYGLLESYRMTGWSNYQGVEFELERRYSQGIGCQVAYNMGNALSASNMWTSASDDVLAVRELNMFLPGKVPLDITKRNRLLNYQRDTSTPKHNLRWNWIVDLPFGKGKPIGGNAGGFVDRLIGGWQIAGLGSVWSTYFALPTGIYPNGNPIEFYGYKYPIQDCTSGVCWPGYLWTNAGYIPANRINSYDPATGKPNGIMGVPANYKPAAQPLWPWPASPSSTDPMLSFYGTNTIWVPLKTGAVVRTTYSDNLHPWRQQYLPSVWQWGLDASLFKTIPIKERFIIRVNADFFNVLNHPNNPSSVASTGVLSTRSSANPARELQLTLRLTW